MAFSEREDSAVFTKDGSRNMEQLPLNLAPDLLLPSRCSAMIEFKGIKSGLYYI